MRTVFYVVDKQTMSRVSKPYTTRKSASRRVDKLDNIYGGYRYFVQAVDIYGTGKDAIEAH